MPDQAPTERPRRDPRPYVFVERPKCPRCGSPDLRTYGTRKGGDGTISRYAQCRACLVKLVVVLE